MKMAKDSWSLACTLVFSQFIAMVIATIAWISIFGDKWRFVPLFVGIAAGFAIRILAQNKFQA